MVIQAIFFDIDGTLIPHGQYIMPQTTQKVLYLLKKKGIKLFIATGIVPHNITFIQNMFPFDGFLTANGQYCFNDQKVIFEKYIPISSLQQVIPYIEDHHIPVLFAKRDQCYRNSENQNPFDSQFPIIDLHKLPLDHILQIMPQIDASQDEEFLKHLPYCQAARWTNAFADMIPIDGGKQKGIDHIIKEYHINLQDVMAIGDGGNDISMLDYVTYSVAMGNASDEVKKHAQYVTHDIEHDGILNAMIHFGLIQEGEIDHEI